MNRKQREYKGTLYLLIGLVCGCIGFIYTAFYSGWGHHPGNALPFAVVFVLIVMVATLISTDHLPPKKQLTTLSIMLLIWTTIALGIYFRATYR